MGEFVPVTLMNGTYQEFKDNQDKIPNGAICFCDDIGKMFIKMGNEVQDMSSIHIQEVNSEQE